MPKFSNSNKLRIVHLLNHLALAYGLVAGEWWMWLAAFFVWNLIGSFGISIGYHRLLSHKSFRTSLWLTNLFSFIGCLATGGSPLSWVGSHRLHHASPDGKLDPHSPIQKGYLPIYLHFWGNVIIPRRHIRDLLKSPFQRFLHRHYFKILVLWAALLYLWDPLIGVFVYSVPAVFAFHAFGMINTLCHKFGYRNFEVKDTSTNNWFVNIWTCGEGWHNNHHKNPSSYRIGLKRYEFDLSAFLIEALRLRS